MRGDKKKSSDNWFKKWSEAIASIDLNNSKGIDVIKRGERGNHSEQDSGHHTSDSKYMKAKE